MRIRDVVIYIPIRPNYDLPGVVWKGQRRRINLDPILSQEAEGVAVTSTPGGTHI